jgi:hypothetical protein
MCERAAGPSFWQTLNRWLVIAMLAEGLPIALVWFRVSDRLYHPIPMVLVVGLGYWGLGLVFCMGPVFLASNGQLGRARAGEIVLQVAIGVACFTLPVISSLLALSLPIHLLPVFWGQGVILRILRATCGLPLYSGILAAGAYRLHRTPVALWVTGACVAFGLFMIIEGHTAIPDLNGGSFKPGDPLCASERIQLFPRDDLFSPTGIYIPKDLEEAVVELDNLLPRCALPKLLKDSLAYHHGIGMWLRNSWGLWGNSRLAQEFHRQGVHHPDSMSHLIFVAYIVHLHRKQPAAEKPAQGR